MNTGLPQSKRVIGLLFAMGVLFILLGHTLLGSNPETNRFLVPGGVAMAGGAIFLKVRPLQT